MKNISIKNKLLLLTIIPLVALLLIGGSKIIKDYNTKVSYNNLEKIVILSTKISALVHETQKERGMTAGYIGSKGEKFSTKLLAQRELTNTKKQELDVFLKNIDIASISLDVQSKLNNALSDMSAINNNRSQITSLTMSLGRALSYYTNMNAKFLSIVIASSKMSESKEVTNALIAYSSFLLSKERAGIERAVGTNILAVKEFKNGSLAKFTSLIAAQNTYMANFLDYASLDSLNFYKEIMQGKSIDDVNKIRKIILNASNSGDFGLESSSWFSIITKKINKLKAIDDYLAKRLIKTINTNMDKTSNEFIILSIEILLLIIVTAVLGMSISNGIARNLKNFQNGLLSFFKYVDRKINDIELISVKSNDEIGQMAKIVNENILKTKQLIEEDKVVIEEINDVLGKVSDGFFMYEVKGNTSNPTVEGLKNSLNTMVTSSYANLRIIMKTLDNLGESNFDYEIPEKKGASGAYGTLSASTRLLASNVSELLAMIMKNGNALQESTAILSHSSTDLSASSNAQAASLEETAAALEEITSIVSSNASNVVRMSNITKELTETASIGIELASQTNVSMNEIDKEVNSINEAITIIDQIAFQTNILSLNAAVEAATAGEAGKGFAVVAQEVRNLASRSADAANEIKALVESAKMKANGGRKTSEDMINGYNELRTKINETSEIVEEVRTASKEQELGIMQINDAVTSLDQTTQQNANTASEISDLSKEVADMSNALIDAASKAKFNPSVENQICDLDMVHLVAKLKGDHIKFKVNNFQKLGNLKTWKVSTCEECDLGIWMNEQEKDGKNFTKTANWERLKLVHTGVHGNVQSYIDADSKKESNKTLENLAYNVENSTVEVFKCLDILKVDNCKD